MPSPERPPFKIFSPIPRHSRSHPALPKSRDDLSWEDAVDVIERSQSQSQSQSYFHGKMTSVHRKIQALRPSSRSGERHVGSSDHEAVRRHHNGTLEERRSLEHQPLRRYGDRHYLDVWNPTQSSLDQETGREYIGAQIASCLPPSHLDGPPPPYMSKHQIGLIDPSDAQTLRPLVRKPTDNLFFEPLGLGLQIPDFKHHRRSHSADARLTQQTPTETRSIFELEHWARMEQAYGVNAV